MLRWAVCRHARHGGNRALLKDPWLRGEIACGIGNRSPIKNTKDSLLLLNPSKPCKIGNGRNTVSRVLFRRRELTEPHWVPGQTRWVLRKTRWVRLFTQILGWEELTEFSPRNSVRAKRLTEFGVWSRTLRNHIRPVSDKRRVKPCKTPRQKGGNQKLRKRRTEIGCTQRGSYSAKGRVSAF